MHDAEAVAHHLLDAVEHLVAAAVAAIVDPHVAAEGRQARGDAPDVQVVHLDDPRDGADGGAHLVEADARRGGFEQHVRRLADQAHGADDDDEGDDPGQDRVETVPAGDADDDAAGEHPDRREGVAHDVHARAADVQAAVGARQDAERQQIDQQPRQRDPGHQPALDGQRRRESLEGLVEHGGRDQDQQRAVRERGQDLQPVVSIGLLGRGGQRSQAGRHEAEHQGEQVGQHVPGVGDQRQAPGQQAADDLDDQDRPGEGDDGDQLPRLGPARFEGLRLDAHGRLLLTPRPPADPSRITAAAA